LWVWLPTIPGTDPPKQLQAWYVGDHKVLDVPNGVALLPQTPALVLPDASPALVADGGTCLPSIATGEVALAYYQSGEVRSVSSRWLALRQAGVIQLFRR
jgi:hypothetical protein